MRAGEQYLMRYLEGRDKRFVIPVYQRSYDWKREHCERLFNDILNIARQEQKSYFMGSIVSLGDEGTIKSESLIIDGQQRITAITLILLVIRNLLNSGEIKTEDSSTLSSEIVEEFLLDKYSPDEKRIKLKHIKSDNKAFLKLFDAQPAEYVQKSNVTQSYNIFAELIRNLPEHDVTILAFYEAIQKLMIVNVRLQRGEDNPQLIFDSLNSTGKELEESDRIRNFILMDKEPDVQEKLYDKYWDKIERNTHFKVGDFIRDYLTYACSKVPRKDRVYVEFKKYVQERYNTDKKLEDLLEKLLESSQFYGNFLSFNTNNKEIDEILERLNRSKITVSYPFMIDVFYAWRKEGIIDAKVTVKILNIIESFLVRRVICNAPTNSLNSIFAILGRNIRKIKKHKENYFEIFKYRITAGKISNRFPDDKEFEDELIRRDVYHLQSKNRVHIFERLEHYKNKEKVGARIAKGELTFEHIMPQNLTKEWKKDLGDNYDDVHQKYLHTIGNITLTASNSNLSNKSFLEKVQIFEESQLWLNKPLTKLNKWTEEEIKKRAKALAERSIEIWPFPESNYAPPKKENTEILLDYDYDFTGKKVKSFSFMDRKYSVSTWLEVYQKALDVFYERDSVRLLSLIDEPNYARYMGRTEKSHKKSLKMNDNIHLNTDLSAQAIVDFIKDLFVEFNLDESEFVIILHDDTNPN